MTDETSCPIKDKRCDCDSCWPIQYAETETEEDR